MGIKKYGKQNKKIKSNKNTMKEQRIVFPSV